MYIDDRLLFMCWKLIKNTRMCTLA